MTDWSKDDAPRAVRVVAERGRVSGQARAEHAREAAEQGITLLVNRGRRLPLRAGQLSLAVVGPNADSTAALQGNYKGRAPVLRTVAAGLAGRAGVTVAHAPTVAPSPTVIGPRTDAMLPIVTPLPLIGWRRPVFLYFL